MFVKIIRNGGKDETLYECKKVHLINFGNDELGGGNRVRKVTTLILDEGTKVENKFEIFPEMGESIIYMNGQGKTIDRKVWK